MNNLKVRKILLSIYFVFSLITVGFIGLMVFEGVVDEGGVKAASTLYVGADQTYTNIQDAINNAIAGDTIRIYTGTYYENVIVNKTVTLIGNGTTNTIIDGNGTGDVVYISANWVNISKVGINNSGSWVGWSELDAGIEIRNSNTNISNCAVHNNYNGIFIYLSMNNNITNCRVYNNSNTGISIWKASFNNISNCEIYSNENGISPHLYDNVSNCNIYNNHIGIHLNSQYNNITNCKIYHNWHGIYSGGSYNKIINCDIYDQWKYGIYFYYAKYNNISNCNVYNHSFDGIYFEGADYNNISTSKIYNNNIGLYLFDSANYNEIFNCHIFNNPAWGGPNSNGIYLKESSHNKFSHCNIYENDSIYLYSSSNNEFKYCKIYNTTFGINIYYYSDFNQILNCDLYNNSLFSIRIKHYSDYNKITNCRIYGNPKEGIFIQDSSLYNKISTCYVFNNNRGINIEGGSHRNEISDCHIYNNSRRGILIKSSSYIKILTSEIYNNSEYGIYESSFGTRITNCNVYNNKCGIYSYRSKKTEIFLCNVYNNSEDGIHFYRASNIILRSDILSNNTYNFNVEGYNIDEFTQNIDTSNTINGKPIYYMQNTDDLNFDGSLIDIGYLGLVSCNNFTLKNLNMTNNGQGVLIFDTSNSSVENSSFSINKNEGIYLWYSSNTNITNCSLYDNYHGVYLYSSYYNQISSCDVYNNTRYGIYIQFCLNFNQISKCRIYNNFKDGIHLSDSQKIDISNCEIYNNSEYGIFFWYSFDNNISYCEIYNNYQGLFLNYSSNASIHKNYIFNNTKYGINNRDPSIVINATRNWWGNYTGPYDPSDDRATGGWYNPFGQGDNISDFVAYRPWGFKNYLPTINTTDILISKEDNLYLRNYFVIDSNGDFIHWSVSNNASWLFWNSTSNKFYGTPTNLNLGSYWVCINITDGYGGYDEHNFTITVVNKPPTLLTNDIGTATEDQVYYNDYDSDDDGQGTITWKLNTNADWLNFDTSTGILNGTPTNDNVGDYWVNITVNDGNGGIGLTNFTLTVVNANDAPFIQTTDIISINEDEYYEVIYTATEIDIGDALIWTYESNATWLNWDSTNHTLIGTPNNEHVGSYWVRINITDSNGGNDEHYFVLTVLNINDIPTIDTIDKTSINEDELYNVIYQATEIDIDDTLIWTYESNATWLHWGPLNQTIYGKPFNNDVGQYWIKINITDGNGGYDEHKFNLIVINVNDAPNIKNNIEDFSIDEDTIDFTIKLYDWFIDIDGDKLTYRYTGNENIEVFIIENHIVKLIPKVNWNGKETLTFFANDSLLETSDDITISVLSINDPPKEAKISLAKMKYYEGQFQPAIGNATDVDLPYGDELTFKWFRNSTEFIDMGEEINLSLPIGLHQITLNVTDKDGAGCESSITIEIHKTPIIIDDEIDSDNDNYPDNIDLFPDDLTQWLDKDGDNFGDNLNGTNPDVFPNNPTQWLDTDGDNYGDNPNGTNHDAFPNNPAEWLDSDGDNYGDNIDEYPNDLTKWKIVKEEKEELPDKKDKTEIDSSGMILGFAVIIIMIIIILISLLLFKKKKKEKIDLDTSTEVVQNAQIQPKTQLPQPQQVLQRPQSSQIQTIQQPQQPKPVIAQPIQQSLVTTTTQPQLPKPNLCSTCNQPLTYYSQTNKYYCHQCQKYV